jgi:hypothetical protein
MHACMYTLKHIQKAQILTLMVRKSITIMQRRLAPMILRIDIPSMTQTHFRNTFVPVLRSHYQQRIPKLVTDMCRKSTIEGCLDVFVTVVANLGEEYAQLVSADLCVCVCVCVCI